MSDTVHTEAPVIITLSIADLARHLVPGYDSEYQETVGVPALDALLKAVAQMIAKDIRKSLVDKASLEAEAQVRSEVERIVVDTLTGAVAVTDPYGRSQPGRTIQDTIADEVKKWSGIKDSYGNRETNMAKFIRETVDRAMKEELKAVLDEERQRFREAVRQIAAATLADDAAKRR